MPELAPQDAGWQIITYSESGMTLSEARALDAQIGPCVSIIADEETPKL